MMRVFFLMIWGCCLALFLTGAPAPYANAQNCNVQEEVIFKLRDPDLPAYSIWGEVYGKETHEESFSASVMAPKNRVLSVGVRQKQGDRKATLILAFIDKRGRLVKDREYDVPGLYEATEILRTNDGYIVLGNRTNKGGAKSAWLGFFDAKADLLSERTIKSDQGSLVGRGLMPFVPSRNASRKAGGDFIMAATIENRAAEMRSYSVLYHLNNNGDVQTSRSFYVGNRNIINSVHHDGFGGVIAAGYLENSGVKGGWIVRLNNKLGIVWQQQYTRGVSSHIESAKFHSENYLVAAGHATAYGGQRLSVWTMMVDIISGTKIWERFYRDEFDLSAQDILAHDDGRISVVFNAVPPPSIKEPRYSRLATLSPRGALFDVKAFYNGLGGSVSRMMFGPSGERILTGNSTVLDKIHPDDPDDMGIVNLDGWLFAAEAAEIYTDPCPRPGGRIE